MAPLRKLMGPCIFAVLAVVPDDALSVLTSTLIDELVLDKLYQIRNDFIDDQQKRRVKACAFTRTSSPLRGELLLGYNGRYD